MASYGSSMISGAGTGAAVGAAFGPYGAAIGGGLGLLAGFFAASEAEEDAEKKRKILEQAKTRFGLDQDEIEGLMKEYYDNPENFLGTAEDVAAFRESISDYNPQDFVYNFKPYEYDKTVDDFINPYYDQIIGDTEKRISHSAAGAGIGRGTGAAKAIAQGVAEKEDQLYNTALQQYNTDRTQNYNEWAGNIQAMQNRLNQLKSAYDTKMNLQGKLADDFVQQNQNKYSDLIAAKQARSNGNLQLANSELMI